MYINFIMILLAAVMVSCVPTTPSRLPEPTAEIGDPVQWQDFCQREGRDDPACKKE